MDTNQEAADWAAALAMTIRAQVGRRDMKPADMARATGMAPTVYWRLHKGKRSISTTQLRAIARALDMTPGELFDLADIEAKDPVARELRRAGLSADELDGISDARKGEVQE